MHGWLNVNKPAGITSFDVVRHIRRKFGIKKVGHAGTLDPFASGVLPVAIGHATKLIDVMMNETKKYRFKVKFGIKTTTGDVEGEILETKDSMPTYQELNAVLPNFVGEIYQTPHKFSAIKIGGRRAYDLARKNIDFCIYPRKVNIYDLQLLNFDKENKEAELVVVCSKGTYIRSLAEDIALSLHSLCFVVELIRDRVGSFDLEFAKDFSDLKLSDLLSMDSLLDDILVLSVGTDVAKRLRNGQCVPVSTESSGVLYAKSEGAIVAIVEVVADSDRQKFLKPKKVFVYQD